MKRTFILLLTAMLIAGAMVGGSADAAKKKKKKKKKPPRIERVVEFDYQCPCGPRVAGQGTGWQLGSATGENIGGGPISIGLDDKYLRGEVTDASGQPVQVTINQDTDGDGLNNYVGDFCGSTGDEPIEVVPALEIRVFISAGTCNDASGPSVPTQGSIEFIFSNKP